MDTPATAASFEVQVRAGAAAGAAAQRGRTQDLIEEVERKARDTLRWGAEAAGATF